MLDTATTAAAATPSSYPPFPEQMPENGIEIGRPVE